MGNSDISANCSVSWAMACSGAGWEWFGIEGDIEGTGGYVIWGEEWEYGLDGGGG